MRSWRASFASYWIQECAGVTQGRMILSREHSAFNHVTASDRIGSDRKSKRVEPTGLGFDPSIGRNRLDRREAPAKRLACLESRMHPGASRRRIEYRGSNIDTARRRIGAAVETPLSSGRNGRFRYQGATKLTGRTHRGTPAATNH